MLKLFSLIFVLFFVSCGAYHTDENTAHQNWPAKSILFDNFRDAKQYLIVYSREDVEIGKRLQQAVKSLGEISDRYAVVIKTDDSLTEEELKTYPLYIVGTSNNLLIKRLDTNIPIDLVENGFEFDNKRYQNKTDILKISFYPNPFNPQMPVSVMMGNNELVLADFIDQQFIERWGGFFWDSWGYQLIRDNKRTILGNFSEDSATLWAIDKKVHWEFDRTGELVASSRCIDVYDHASKNPKERIDNYLLTTENTITKIETFANRRMANKYPVHLYVSMETKALMDNNADQTTVDAGNNVHTVIGEAYENISDGFASIPAIRMLLGNAQLKALENGMAVYFTENWQRYGYYYWGSRLYAGHAFPKLEELLTNELFEPNSPLIINCMSAMFIDFLIETKGAAYLLAHYTSWTDHDATLLALEPEWDKFLSTHYTGVAVSDSRIKPANKFLKGFNFAHEGYSIYNGYMGTTAIQSLEHLKSIGCNTISILPYSGFRSMSDPHPFRLNEGAGTENDAAVVRSAYQAKQLGFTVVLKPQIWSWMGWTGDITMADEAQWNLFFEYYGEWIKHYAMLAEIYHMDILCVGNEFKNATLTHQAKWEKLFDEVREIYSGKITYAANWGDEFEKVTFWHKLDYIAVNCYYPLSAKQNPTDEELMEQMEKNLDVIESVQKKYNKPLLFTEIGFKSIDSPWISPHKDDDEQNYNETSQKRCYEVMFKAMEDEPWINGIYLWKWPTYMEFSKEYEKDFNPCDKQAEAVIKTWFEKY